MPVETPHLVHTLRALTVELDLLGSEFARTHGLHPTDVRAMICLLDAQRAGIAATPGWLGTQLRLESASITALVDRMEKAGHIRRDRDSADRRRILLSVTPAAIALGESFFGPLIEAGVDVLDHYSAKEQATIDRFLTHMLTAVRH